MDEARKYERGEIESRLARLEACAMRPTATETDRVLTDDWRAILAAKENIS